MDVVHILFQQGQFEFLIFGVYDDIVVARQRAEETKYRHICLQSVVLNRHYPHEQCFCTLCNEKVAVDEDAIILHPISKHADSVLAKVDLSVPPEECVYVTYADLRERDEIEPAYIISVCDYMPASEDHVVQLVMNAEPRLPQNISRTCDNPDCEFCESQNI